MAGGQALTTISKPRSAPCEQPSKATLIREWIGKLALNAGQALTPTTAGVFEALWLEGLGDLAYGVLERAFRRTLQTCKYWPVRVSDIREQADRGREAYAQAEGDIKWANVLEYIRLFWNPDLPGGASAKAPPISPRVTYAIKCAGGLAEIAECPREHLHFKRELFLEAYGRWDALRKDEFLLPEGSVKALIRDSFIGPSPETLAKVQDVTNRTLALIASREPKP
jgi:hypothetical protein